MLHGIIDDFNASQPVCRVVVEDSPQESYNDSVSSAELAGNLPDIIDVDGPIMPNWARAGYLDPLNIEQEAVDRLLTGARGSRNGEVYAVGLWDAAVAIFACRCTFEANGIRIPSLDDP